jgi:outer membrane protein assembly factor BamB
VATVSGRLIFYAFFRGTSPEAPDMLWKTTIKGIQSYPVAFDGKVFVTTQTQVIALYKDTGNIIWNTTVQSPDRWPAVYKINDTRLVTDRSCLDIETGKVLWVSNDFSPRVSFFAAGLYSPKEKNVPH